MVTRTSLSKRGSISHPKGIGTGSFDLLVIKEGACFVESKVAFRLQETRSGSKLFILRINSKSRIRKDAAL